MYCHYFTLSLLWSWSTTDEFVMLISKKKKTTTRTNSAAFHCYKVWAKYLVQGMNRLEPSTAVLQTIPTRHLVLLFLVFCFVCIILCTWRILFCALQWCYVANACSVRSCVGLACVLWVMFSFLHFSSVSCLEGLALRPATCKSIHMFTSCQPCTYTESWRSDPRAAIPLLCANTH